VDHGFVERELGAFGPELFKVIVAERSTQGRQRICADMGGRMGQFRVQSSYCYPSSRHLPIPDCGRGG